MRPRGSVQHGVRRTRLLARSPRQGRGLVTRTGRRRRQVCLQRRVRQLRTSAAVFVLCQRRRIVLVDVIQDPHHGPAELPTALRRQLLDIGGIRRGDGQRIPRRLRYTYETLRCGRSRVRAIRQDRYRVQKQGTVQYRELFRENRVAHKRQTTMRRRQQQ